MGREKKRRPGRRAADAGSVQRTGVRLVARCFFARRCTGFGAENAAGAIGAGAGAAAAIGVTATTTGALAG